MNEQDRQQRLYVAKMAEKLRAGKISRREFIRAAEQICLLRLASF